VFEWDGTTEREYVVDPAELGLARATLEDLRGGNAEVNAAIAKQVLAGALGPHRDIVVLNAAAGLLVGGAVADLAAGVQLAGATIDAGAAADALDRLVSASQAAVVG
jgi:anthranilate phosphoribosyltransferase